MSNPKKSLAEQFDDLEIKFVTSPPRKPMVTFEEMNKSFPMIEPNNLIPGNNYFVFSKNPLGKDGDSCNIVKYLNTFPNGDISVSEMFMRGRTTYGWSNIPNLMKGSRFYKDPKTYEKIEVYSKQTYKNLTEREKRRVEYVFKDLGPRGNEITIDTPDESINDIIDDIIKSKQIDEPSVGGNKRRIKRITKRHKNRKSHKKRRTGRRRR